MGRLAAPSLGRVGPADLRLGESAIGGVRTVAVPDAASDRILIFSLLDGVIRTSQLARRDGAWTWADLPGSRHPVDARVFVAASDGARRRVYVAACRRSDETRWDLGAADCSDPAGIAWTSIEASPALEKVHRMSMVVLDGVLVVARSRSRTGPVEMYAGRVDGARVALRSLPTLADASLAGVWLDPATDSLLVTMVSSSWEEPLQLRRLAWSQVRRLADR